MTREEEKSELKKQDTIEKKVPKEDKQIEINESEYQKLLQEAEEYKDKYYRLAAEFDNARKRMERDKEAFVKYANEGLILEFLGILDNLERSVEAAKAKHQDYTAFLKGVELVMAQVLEMLKKNGVHLMKAQGEVFDPHCHEVMMQEESQEAQDGQILEEFQKGYMIGARVVRTAKVKVAKRIEK